ncbi:MAG: hypothetical protein WC538_07435 [Thermoanaerobaculia bacterium]|jgi:hypothetical protein
MKPPRKAAREAAGRLLVQWLDHEEPLHLALHEKGRARQREALGRAATYFGVVRGLRRGPEERLGVPRFELLRRCFAGVDGERVSAADVAPVATGVAESVARAYGGTLYLSLATKLLWAKYRDPFVIYDSVVREHLGTPKGDYAAYLEAWHECYASHRGALVAACNELASKPSAPDRGARGIVTEEWFRRRAFDLMIWHHGA